MSDSEDRWIIIPNWDKFQHYGDRDPTWIKVYNELNSRDDWRRLPYSERGLLVTIWVEFCRSDGRLRVQDLGPRGGQRVRLRSLETLNHAGFIHFSASKPLALTRSREKRREEKNYARALTRNKKPVGDSKQNAVAYRRHDPDEPFDYEAALAEITKRAGR